MHVCMNAWAKHRLGETSWVVWRRHSRLIDKICLSFWGHTPSDFRIQILCYMCFSLIVNAPHNLIRLKVVVRTCSCYLQKIVIPKQRYRLCWSNSALCYTISSPPWEYEQRKSHGPILSTFPESPLELLLVFLAVFIYRASAQSMFQCCHPVWGYTPSAVILINA